MQSTIRYKKQIVLCAVAAVVAAGLLVSCSKKSTEQDITITLKTEGATPAPAAAHQAPAPLPKPAAPEHRKPAHRVRNENRGITHEQEASRPVPHAPEQIAAAVPSPGPTPQEIAQQQILAIIGRQKQAMVTKNVQLALQDVAGNNEQNRQALEEYFDRYEKIDVSFSNIAINVAGTTATAVMNQKTTIVTKSLIPQAVTELTKVQWTFVQESGRWLISGTQILSRMKDR